MAQCTFIDSSYPKGRLLYGYAAAEIQRKMDKLLDSPKWFVVTWCTSESLLAWWVASKQGPKALPCPLRSMLSPTLAVKAAYQGCTIPYTKIQNTKYEVRKYVVFVFEGQNNKKNFPKDIFHVLVPLFRPLRAKLLMKTSRVLCFKLLIRHPLRHASQSG